ncbi:MAG TPA: transporter substrate-binding domain-containing protein [Roseateles sp.]
MAPAQQAPITVHYNNRPPYLMPQADGSVEGLTGSVAKAAFITAGLPVVWRETPTNRQLLLIESGSGRDCAVGWFRNAQREQFARFTTPIYRDQPWVVIAGQHYPLPNNATIAQILAAKELRLLVKDRFSYGADLDGKISQYTGETVTTTGEWPQIIGMLIRSRADYMFASQEEAHYFAASADGVAAGLRVLAIADAPPGEFRHIMCSKKVSDADIAALNAAIAANASGQPGGRHPAAPGRP